ncbi:MULTISPECIES: SDR family oxidoreductase [Janibacter]|uniref:SDR family oxidoreductase n=1 Tax=Janibacter TaxID=53457 RepID=UPI0008305B90|nr:SDR family oxidoreductase [Janibacter terrae]
MDLALNGKVALVTAASRGIGRATAERLASEGATVIAAARTEGREVEELGTGRIVPLTVDLGEAGAAADLVERVRAEHGSVDVLVANTPGPKLSPALELTWQDWSAAHDALLRPVVEMMTAAGKVMVEQGRGSMVLVSSSWVRQPSPAGVLSAAYRSAQSSFVKSLAAEIAPRGVRVNQVLVGATGTERMEKILRGKAEVNGTDRQTELDRVVADIPLGRWGEAHEIGDLIAFLASDLPGFSTGSSFVIDGGAIRAAH